MAEPIRIIGVGNPLMADDGAGTAAIAALQRRTLPAGVAAIDGGTGGLTLLDLMAGAERVLLIDAVRGGRPPGTLSRLEGADLAGTEPGAGELSLHQAGLAAVLALGRELGLLPPLTLYAIEPETVERRLGLSPAVRDGVDRAVAAILAELG